jgi:predicted XRE-type DNA-binding protein
MRKKILWKDKIFDLLMDKKYLRRKEIISALGVSRHTLNILLSKNKDLFQHDDLGFGALKIMLTKTGSFTSNGNKYE